MQATPNRTGLPPRLPSKTPSPIKQNSPFNHVPLSVKQTNPLSSNKMANRLLQLAEVRKKSEMMEVPKPKKIISLQEYTAKKAAVWEKIRFINEQSPCVSDNKDFIEMRNLLLEFSKITPVQICSAVRGAIDEGYYVDENDYLIDPTPEPTTPEYVGSSAYYNNGAPKPSAPPSYLREPSAPPANASYYTGPSAPPANNYYSRTQRGGTKRKNRKGRKTRRN